MLKLIIFLKQNVKLNLILYTFGYFPYIISVTANIVTIKTRETREVQIGLKHDGSLMDTYNLPKCGKSGSNQTIHLVSYKYHQLQCHFAGDCSSVHEEPLLPDEVFHLHQMCSMQQQCENLSFPLRSEAQRKSTNAMMIRYECIASLKIICQGQQTTRNINVKRSTSVGRRNGTQKLPTTTTGLAIDDVTKSVILPETTCSQHNRTLPALLIITLLTLCTVLFMSTVLMYVLQHRRKKLK